MINNRQAGRRRGRGGGGNNGPRQGRSDNGNRIDSRARGNAAQLLEKYRNLAADAQRQGDRVNTEYYLQFADHYFRVLSDQRGRSDDQSLRRGRDEFDADGDEEFGEEGDPIRAGEQGGGDLRRERAEREPRRDREDRGERSARGDSGRGDSARGEGSRGDASRGESDRRPREQVEVAGQHRADAIAPDESLAGRAEAVLEADSPPGPRRRGRPRRDAAEQADAGSELEADRLPPSLMAPANDAGEEVKPRRRRARGPAADVPSAAE